MAVRIGNMQDSTLVARRLGTIRSTTCASRSYLAQHGIPASPDDLHQHIGLPYSNIDYKQQWRYETPKEKTIHAQPQIRVRTNNGEVLAAAAGAGPVITTGQTFLLGRYVEDGSLVAILNEYQRPSSAIYAVYPPGRLMPGRVLVFTDFLAGRYGDHLYWENGLMTALPIHCSQTRTRRPKQFAQKP